MCVVTALAELREAAPRRFGNGPESHLPLFRWASGQVLRRLEVQNLLQRAAKEVELPAERFQSHSLRIGGASALYQATGEVELVKRSGRSIVTYMIQVMYSKEWPSRWQKWTSMCTTRSDAEMERKGGTGNSHAASTEPGCVAGSNQC